MTFSDCHSALPLDEQERVRFCAHPRVFASRQLVTPEMCRVCTLSNEPPPTSMRLPSSVPSFSAEARPRSVAVVIPCHNYGRYLAECLESVLVQTHPAKEIVVVDDRSTDNTREVAAQFESANVQYRRVDFGNVHDGRRVGYEATTSEVLCFLDADDRLSDDYLAKGMAQFGQTNIGIVYSDMRTFGSQELPRTYPDAFDGNRLQLSNFMHAGSLVSREAVRLSAAFDMQIAASVANTTGDWLLWKRVTACGWSAKKQSASYLYRQHAASSTQRINGSLSYFESAGLRDETVTLFIPLSGRESHWSRLSAFLERQQWPHDQTRLVLFNTSHDVSFNARVRNWASTCDYIDVRVIQRSVGRSGLADLPRLDAVDEVRVSMARIYNSMAGETTTPFVWILEDDIEPPDDACRRLLNGFDQSTFSVSGAYRSRFHSGFVAWDQAGNTFHRPQSGLTSVGGNGFGCVILRRASLQGNVFTANGPLPDFDKAFYARNVGHHRHARLDWSVACDHRDAEEVQHAPAS